MSNLYATGRPTTTTKKRTTPVIYVARLREAHDISELYDMWQDTIQATKEYGIMRPWHQRFALTEIEQTVCTHWSLAVPAPDDKVPAERERYVLAILRTASKELWKWFDAERSQGRSPRELMPIRDATLSIYVRAVRRAFGESFVNHLLDQHGF